MRQLTNVSLAIAMSILLSSCATPPSPAPLSYLALEKPSGVIQTQHHKEMTESFSRGGVYFLNYNFRPAADIKTYLEHAIYKSDVSILRNADIQLRVPFAFDILLFGYNNGSDTVTVK